MLAQEVRLPGGGTRVCRDVLGSWLAGSASAMAVDSRIWGLTLPTPWPQLLSHGLWTVIGLANERAVMGRRARLHFRIQESVPGVDDALPPPPPIFVRPRKTPHRSITASWGRA
eukprot:5529448-Lingulodinium_polyedra.AAC.1